MSALGGDLFHPGAGLVPLLLITALNVYKPAGLTPYGWRKQREERVIQREERPKDPRSQTPSQPARRCVRHARPVSTWRAFGARAASFTFHLAEMWFAMLLGMAVLTVAAIVLAAQSIPILSEPTSIGFQVWMGLFMVAPMAVWVRYRGCDWRACGEMSLAMLLSTGLVVAFGALSRREAERWVSSNQHMLMLLGMLVVILYGASVTRAGRLRPLDPRVAPTLRGTYLRHAAAPGVMSLTLHTTLVTSKLARWPT